MKKICFGMAIILGVICFTVTSCFIEDNPDDLFGNITTSEPWGDGTFSGSVEGVSAPPQGGGYGGKITVVLDIELGIITAVDVTHKETASIGGAFINKVKPIIVQANSFEIDAITKATCVATRNGLVDAGKAALRKIPGVVDL